MDQSALTSSRVGFGVRWVATAALGMTLLAGCSHKHKETDTAAVTKVAPEASATAGSGAYFGQQNDGGPKFIVPDAAHPDVPAPMEPGPTPRFVAPKVTGQGAPSVASVPSKAPTPQSSKQEREKTIEGLLSDRDRARYSDSGGRTMPVAIRPLSEAAAKLDEEPATPPKPQAAQVGAVTRLGSPPAPGQQAAAETASGDSAQANVAAAAQIAATATPPARPDLETGPHPSALPVTRSDGFHTLAAYSATTSQSNTVASVDFSGTGTSISAAGRRALADAVQQGDHRKGVFRVVGRAAEPRNIVQERATAVARELQRLGVAQDQIYVGTDSGQDGRVDVILDQ